MNSITIICICSAVFVLIIVVCLVLYMVWQQKSDKKLQEDRVSTAFETKQESFGYSAPDLTSEQIEEKAIAAIRKDKKVSNIPILNLILNKFFKERVVFIVRLIEQTGLPIKVGEFLIFVFLVGIFGALVVQQIFGFPIVGCAAGFIPFMFLNGLREKRKAKFISQMPPALDMMNSDLRAGVDLQQVLKHVADEMSPPICEEFQKVVAEINLGVPVNEAIIHLSERIDTIDVQMLCTGIIINRELGGNLAELVSNVSATVRERFRLKGVIKALTAETSASSYLMMGLPIALFVILNLMCPDTYGDFVRSELGQNILKGCVGSMTLGFFVLKKMSKIEA